MINTDLRKVKFIYNPYSGDQSIIKNLDNIIKIYQERKYTVIPYRINRHESIDNAFYDIYDNYDHILIAGGDGTLDIIINYMKSNHIEIPLAVIPKGTANDFANMIGMKDDIDSSIKTILNSKVNKIDLGKVNEKYFINIASAGMFTDVSQNVDSKIKKRIGKIAYYVKGIEDALTIKKFNVKIKSDELEYTGDIYLILVFNGKTVGNINLAHKSSIDDGLLDVIIFKAMPITKILNFVKNILKGDNLDFDDNNIVYFKTSKLYIDASDDVPTDIDGEKGPKFPLYIECEKKSLEMIYNPLQI